MYRCFDWWKTLQWTLCHRDYVKSAEISIFSGVRHVHMYSPAERTPGKAFVADKYTLIYFRTLPLIGSWLNNEITLYVGQSVRETIGEDKQMSLKF